MLGSGLSQSLEHASQSEKKYFSISKTDALFLLLDNHESNMNIKTLNFVNNHVKKYADIPAML